MTSPPRLRLVENADPRDTSAAPGGIQDALLHVLDADDDLRARFKAACQEGSADLRREVPAFRAALKEQRFKCAHHDREHEETAEALYELAGELMPDSPGAALARLRERVGDRGEPRDAREAVENLAAAEHEWYDELVLLSGGPPRQERLQAVAQKFWCELRDRGMRYEPKGFTDHVWLALRKLFPEASGAGWDGDWATSLYQEVRRDLARHTHEAGGEAAEVDTSGVDEAMNEMVAAEEAEDRICFREAGRRAIHAGRKAVREAARQAIDAGENAAERTSSEAS